MSLKKLSEVELVQNTKKLVGEEKKLTQLVLEHLGEIEGRRTYAARGYSSLFDFCVKELGYSETSALRRIGSMRLIKALPEAKEKLESGKVNLSTLSQLQSFIRKEESFKKVKLDHDQKLELLTSIENKSQRDCEKVFIEKSPEMILKTRESTRPLTNESIEFKFVGSKEFEEKVNELKNLLAHQNKTNSTSELFELIVDMALKQLKTEKEGNVVTGGATAGEVNNSVAAIRREVFSRDKGQCQYIDPLTKRKCLSKYKIQIDHIHPKALGGEDSKDNLRLLCREHNTMGAIHVFSQKHMSQFLPGLG